MQTGTGRTFATVMLTALLAACRAGPPTGGQPAQLPSSTQAAVAPAALVPTAIVHKRAPDDLVAAARREGKVRFSSALEPREVADLISAFKTAYPGIEVEYARTGAGEDERILLAMRAGTYEWDVLSIEAESFPRYRENDAVLSYKWTEAFGTNPRIVHPDGNVIAVGSQVAGIAYNTNLVPVPPTSWDDCADPAYSGKKLFDVRPNPLVTNWSAWGEEKTLDYVRRVRAGTTFVRGNTQAYTMLAAGEMSIYCAGNFGPFTRFKQSAPTAPVEMAFPEGPLLGQISLEFAALKGSPNQNAAILLLGWISTEGLAYLKETGRDSFFSPSSNLAQVATRLERDVVVLDWSYWEHSADIQQRILQEWGFPRAAN